MDLSNRRKKEIDKAMKAYINGDSEPLKLVNQEVYYALTQSDFAGEVVEESYQIVIRDKKRKAKKLRDDRRAAAKAKASCTSLKDREYDMFADIDIIIELEGYMENAVIVDESIEYLDDKGNMNATCLTGIYQIMWKYNLLKPRYNGRKMTMTRALVELNETYKSKIGCDFFRKDPSFIKAAIKRMPELKELLERLEKKFKAVNPEIVIRDP